MLLVLPILMVKKMKYIIEIKKRTMTKYTKSKMYLCWINGGMIHVTTEIEQAHKFSKGSLAKIYRHFGRNNVIKHLIKD